MNRNTAVDWSVGLVKRHFETVFQSISCRLSERERDRERLIDERKIAKPPSVPAASTVLS